MRLSTSARKAVASCTFISALNLSRNDCENDKYCNGNAQLHGESDLSSRLPKTAPMSGRNAYGSCLDRIYSLNIFQKMTTPFMSFCDITEIDRMEDIRDSINSGTLLIYDIDNTIFEPVGNYGSDQWFYYLHKVYQMDGFCREESEEKALDLWNHTQSLIKVRPVEPCTPNLIKDHQAMGVKIIAMTARTPSIADVTMGQLKSIDVNFADSTISNTGTMRLIHSSCVGDLLFIDGVFFVGEKNSKGDSLMLLLQALNYTPENVVFVDDRLRHLEAVEKNLKSREIPFKGYRYGGADKKVRAFDDFTSEISDKKTADLFYFGKRS